MQLRPIGRDYYNKPTTNPSDYYNNLFKPENRDALDWLLEERKLDLLTIEKFRIGLNESGNIAIPVFRNGELLDYKFRKWKEKGFYRVKDSETWVINEGGFELAYEKGYIIITEGEFDCMAVWQMGFGAVITGTGGVKGTTEWLNLIPDGIKVYINSDNDEVGQEYAKKIADRLGIERCYNVILPTKDANDFIKQGHTAEEYLKALENAKRFDIPGIEKVSNVIEDIRNNPMKRYSTHLRRLDIHTKGGIIKNGFVTIIAKPGTGKSSLLLNFLIHHADEGIPVLLVSLEDDISLTIQRILEIRYKTPISKFTDALWAKARSELVNYPFYVDSSKETNTVNKLRKVVSQAKKLYGVEIVGYDHVEMITMRKDELPEVARQMYNIKNESNVTLYTISHVRKGERDQKMITADDTYGTAAFHQLSNVVIILQNFGKGMELTIEKSRESRSHLRIPIFFNGETGEIKDDESRKVKFFDQEVEDEERLTPFVIDAPVEEPHKPLGMVEDNGVDY